MDRCPMNSTEFEAAARRRNCTGNSRYLCAPDKHLTNLIEFCTDVAKSLYGKGSRFFLKLSIQTESHFINKRWWIFIIKEIQEKWVYVSVTEWLGIPYTL